MKELTTDLFGVRADALVITTNGYVKKNGEGVMGRGCAAEAKRRWLHIAAVLGYTINMIGNHVAVLGVFDGQLVIAMPVKHAWFDRADRELIVRSTKELVVLTEHSGWRSVVLPRPGCGNGGLRWRNVRPILERHLDDRFTVVSFSGEAE